MASQLSSLKTNPYTMDLVLYESDFLNSEKYVQVCHKMEDALSAYIDIMKRLCNQCDGAAADNFKAYADLVRELALNTLGNIGRQISKQIDQYRSDIDTADKQLY